MTSPPEAPPLDTATVRRAARLFREAFWVRALALVVLAAVVFVLLGRWQWGRYEAKVARDRRIAANYSATPRSLDDVLTSTDTLPLEREWSQVAVQGSYDIASTLLVRNRPVDNVYGYEVLVPLRLADGRELMVDRGWIPNGRTGDRPDSVPQAPAGTVQLVVRMRQLEPDTDRLPPSGQLLRIDHQELERVVPGAVRAYGVLAHETPRPATVPQLLPPPDVDLGPHLSYAWQWWGFAVAAVVLVGYYAVKESQRRDLLAAGIDPATVPRRRLRKAPTDEEIEDAQDEG